MVVWGQKRQTIPKAKGTTRAKYCLRGLGVLLMSVCIQGATGQEGLSLMSISQGTGARCLLLMSMSMSQQ